MNDPADEALAYVRQRVAGGPMHASLRVTINFHPDILTKGAAAIDLIAQQKIYRSQFETGTSNGGLTAHVGGDRWIWESRMFGKAYDDAPLEQRPKYGALNHRLDPVGGSRRFGSCHLRLVPQILGRTTFCYPDSYLQPLDFGVAESGALIPLVKENRFGLDPQLDNYIEAHIHGPLDLRRDVEAVVLDPSYRSTPVEESAALLGCPVEWHDGFKLRLEMLPECESFRGTVTADAIAKIAIGGDVTPLVLGQARTHSLDYQTAKWVWHCMAKFGHI
ncbi:MAG: DUF3626 domain-containing protein [Pseudomonadota bacterium]